jgi:hypothetical protein
MTHIAITAAGLPHHLLEAPEQAPPLHLRRQASQSPVHIEVRDEVHSGCP